MENYVKEMSIKDKKADILKEYHRLRDILKQVYSVSRLYRLNVQPMIVQPNDCQLKSILKKPKPSNEIENSTSVPPTSINADCDDKDLFSRIKGMANKSIGPPHQNDANAVLTCPKPVIHLICDKNITKRTPKVIQGRDGQPLRRSKRLRKGSPQGFFQEKYLPSLNLKH